MAYVPLFEAEHDSDSQSDSVGNDSKFDKNNEIGDNANAYGDGNYGNGEASAATINEGDEIEDADNVSSRGFGLKFGASGVFVLVCSACLVLNIHKYRKHGSLVLNRHDHALDGDESILSDNSYEYANGKQAVLSTVMTGDTEACSMMSGSVNKGNTLAMQFTARMGSMLSGSTSAGQKFSRNNKRKHKEQTSKRMDDASASDTDDCNESFDPTKSADTEDDEELGGLFPLFEGQVTMPKMDTYEDEFLAPSPVGLPETPEERREVSSSPEQDDNVESDVEEDLNVDSDYDVPLDDLSQVEEIQSVPLRKNTWRSTRSSSRGRGGGFSSVYGATAATTRADTPLARNDQGTHHYQHQHQQVQQQQQQQSPHPPPPPPMLTQQPPKQQEKQHHEQQPVQEQRAQSPKRTNGGAPLLGDDDQSISTATLASVAGAFAVRKQFQDVDQTLSRGIDEFKAVLQKEEQDDDKNFNNDKVSIAVPNDDDEDTCIAATVASTDFYVTKASEAAAAVEPPRREQERSTQPWDGRPWRVVAQEQSKAFDSIRKAFEPVRKDNASVVEAGAKKNSTTTTVTPHPFVTGKTPPPSFPPNNSDKAWRGEGGVRQEEPPKPVFTSIQDEFEAIRKQIGSVDDDDDDDSQKALPSMIRKISSPFNSSDKPARLKVTRRLSSSSMDKKTEDLKNLFESSSSSGKKAGGGPPRLKVTKRMPSSAGDNKDTNNKTGSLKNYFESLVKTETEKSDSLKRSKAKPLFEQPGIETSDPGRPEELKNFFESLAKSK